MYEYLMSIFLTHFEEIQEDQTLPNSSLTGQHHSGNEAIQSRYKKTKTIDQQP